MATQLAFLVNSDACAGCKTCQVACGDRHDLPAGLHWRKVFEVTAGGWQKKDAAWQSTLAAYYLSSTCNHCETPLCAASCPSDAIWKRPDGIVLIDRSRCTRCRKCQADCPYEAIRWDGSASMVFKCDFCVDAIEAGESPACVVACPNRALGFGELAELRSAHKDGVAQVFPLPDASLAKPALVVLPHRAAATAQGRDPQIANAEEL